MVDSYNEVYDNKEMSSSQKQAIVTLIEKKGKDRSYLENWRPTSLINVDAKKASKVIATRIIPVLPKIINSTQTGYAKGRFIGEAARSILDVMDYTKKKHTWYISGTPLRPKAAKVEPHTHTKRYAGDFLWSWQAEWLAGACAVHTYIHTYVHRIS